MTEIRRGSDELLKAYRAGGRPIEEKLIENLAGRVRDIDIHDILVKGTPKPDLVRAAFLPGDAKAAVVLAADLLEDLNRHDPGLPAKISILTRGIPWPEQFKVELELGEAGI
jgi:hypothetical protein